MGCSRGYILQSKISITWLRLVIRTLSSSIGLCSNTTPLTWSGFSAWIGVNKYNTSRDKGHGCLKTSWNLAFQPTMCTHPNPLIYWIIIVRHIQLSYLCTQSQLMKLRISFSQCHRTRLMIMTGTLLSYIVHHGMLFTMISQLPFNSSSGMAFYLRVSIPPSYHSSLNLKMPRQMREYRPISFHNIMYSGGSRNFFTCVLN